MGITWRIAGTSKSRLKSSSVMGSYNSIYKGEIPAGMDIKANKLMQREMKTAPNLVHKAR